MGKGDGGEMNRKQKIKRVLDIGPIPRDSDSAEVPEVRYLLCLLQLDFLLYCEFLLLGTVS